jgi:hypothetical protein
MRFGVFMLGLLTLAGCTAEQGKQMFNRIGSGVALVESNDMAYALKLDTANQTQVDTRFGLAMPYPKDPFILMSLNPDLLASKGLVTASSTQQGPGHGSTMEKHIAVFDMRSGVKNALRTSDQIKVDLFGSRSAVPSDSNLEEWIITRACWHSDDEIIIGSEFGVTRPDPQQFSNYLKYKLDSNSPGGLSFLDRAHAGATFNSTRPNGYECTRHRLYDTTRFSVQNGTLQVDSTSRNTPIVLKPVTGTPSPVADADAVLFK